MTGGGGSDGGPGGCRGVAGGRGPDRRPPAEGLLPQSLSLGGAGSREGGSHCVLPDQQTRLRSRLGWSSLGSVSALRLRQTRPGGGLGGVGGGVILLRECSLSHQTWWRLVTNIRAEFPVNIGLLMRTNQTSPVTHLAAGCLGLVEVLM